jgi:hypothetical protein
MNRGALFVQAARGPLILITLGCLFALHQEHVISFARTWPLIIIVIGLVKLVERLLMPVPVYQAPYPQGTYPPPAYQQPPSGQPGGPRP